MKLIRNWYTTAFAIAVTTNVLSAAPLPQFAYRDVTLHVACPDGAPVAAAAIYGFCKDLNLIWPRRDHEVRDRNDILWQDSFLGKTGNDGNVKATLPPGHWRFFAAGTTTDGSIIAVWTDAHEPIAGETIPISATATKHWSFCASNQLALTPRRLLVRAQQSPVWMPVQVPATANPASYQMELSLGAFDCWIADDATTPTHPGFALALPGLSSQTPDGRLTVAGPANALVAFKGGKGQSVLSWARPSQFGLEGEITLCDGARVLLSAGDYFLSYRRPIASGLTASFVAQRYKLQAGQAGSLDLDSPLTAGVDENFKVGKKAQAQLFGQLYMADANGHLLGSLLDASHQPVRFDATVTVGGARYPTHSALHGPHKSQASEPGEEIEEDDSEGLAPSPFAPSYLQMLFPVSHISMVAGVAARASWEFILPPGLLTQATLTRQAPVPVSSSCFTMKVPSVLQRQAGNLLMQGDGMIHAMEQVAGHGRSKYSLTEIILAASMGGASSGHNGMRTTIPPRLFYSDQPFSAHTIVHETAHNFGYNHGGLMESIVEATRCFGADQITQQPAKWLFLDRMNGLPTHPEKPYPNVGLYLYAYALGGASMLRSLAVNEPPIMNRLSKENVSKDDITADLLTVATGRDFAAICTNYGLTLMSSQSATVEMQQVQKLYTRR